SGWRGLRGTSISAALLWYISRQIHWAEAAESLRHANYWLIALTAVAATAIFPLRAIRWRIILDPVAPDLPLGKLWRSVAVGMMATNVPTRPAGSPASALAPTRAP